jgi:hypothetical protein
MTTMACTGAALLFDIQAEGLGRRLSLKSLLTSQVMFRKVFPEMLFGIGLLYVFRHIEREVGTRKFVSFCFVSTTLSVTLQLALLTLQSTIIEEGRMFAPGPYGPIFSLMVLYFAYVPAVGTPIGGVRINHKIPVYLAGFLLATQGGKASLIPSCCALIAGVVALFQLKRLVMPESIAKFGVKYIEPLFRTDVNAGARPHGGARGGPFGFGGAYGRFGDFDGGGAAPQDDVLVPNFFGGPPPSAAVNAIPEPSADDIAQLVAMGFDATAAATALRRNRNDVSRAAESLLGSM